MKNKLFSGYIDFSSCSFGILLIFIQMKNWCLEIYFDGSSLDELWLMDMGGLL